MVIAHVDESARPGPEGLYYLVTAGVIVGVDLEQARRTLVKLRPPQGRFHWYRERQQGRMAMLDAMAELGRLPSSRGLIRSVRSARNRLGSGA